jgi:hypothetical protein
MHKKRTNVIDAVALAIRRTVSHSKSEIAALSNTAQVLHTSNYEFGALTN